MIAIKSIKSNNRESNFELMRIISMILIIIWHIIMHGHLIENCGNNAIKTYLTIIQYIIIVHVNSFMILSGYYQSKSKFKLSKLLSIIIEVIMYSIIILIIGIFTGIVEEYNIITFINNLLPSSTSNYWFINTYIVVYIISDYLNKFIDSLSNKEYKNLLIFLFIIFSVFNFLAGNRFINNTGYNFYHFTFLYLVGAYLRRNPLKDSYHFKRISLNGYRLLLIIIFFSMAIFNYLVVFFANNVINYSNLWNEISHRIINYTLTYATPFVIIQTICYFEFFKYINIKNKIINYISSCVFGIYLSHDNTITRTVIYIKLRIDTGLYYSYKKFFFIISAVIIIFVLGLIIEIVRKSIINLLLKNKYIKKIIDKFKEYITSFNTKINW